MRRFLSDRHWQKAASLLVVLYTFCVVGPAAAIAFAANATAEHCFTADHLEPVAPHVHQHATATVHVHQDGSSHQHSIPDGDHSQPGKCCGLFAPSAIAPAIDFLSEPHSHRLPLASVIARSLSGRGSDRIDRPPRSLLSLEL